MAEDKDRDGGVSDPRWPLVTEGMLDAVMAAAHWTGDRYLLRRQLQAAMGHLAATAPRWGFERFTEDGTAMRPDSDGEWLKRSDVFPDGE